MKSLLMTILLTLLLPFSSQANDTIRILCVGNSFSTNAVESHLVDLGMEKGVVFMIANMYYPGCSLEQHVKALQTNEHRYQYRYVSYAERYVREDASLHEALTADRWDIVTLQQASPYSGLWNSFQPYVGVLLDTIAKYQPQAKIYWHQTWAYDSDTQFRSFAVTYNSDQAYMFTQILACTQKVLQTYHFDGLIPCGKAVQYARHSILSPRMCGSDGVHIEPVYGRYTLACTWFEAITGISVFGLQYMPSGMTEWQRLAAQLSAHAAINMMNDE